MKLKYYMLFGCCLTIGILGGVTSTLIKQLKKQKLETQRYQTNFYNSKQSIDSLVTINGDFRYTVNSLQVNINDLEIFNSELKNKLDNSNLKIKNLQNIISTQSAYILQLGDSLQYIISSSGNDTTLINGKYKIFDLRYKDKWIDLKQQVKLSSHGNTIIEYWDNIALKQESFHQEINNDFDIANELIYRDKKWWQFWKKKKVTGIKSHIITDNPYLKIRTIESYKFVNND